MLDVSLNVRIYSQKRYNKTETNLENGGAIEEGEKCRVGQ
jgi:hypothetical protein